MAVDVFGSMMFNLRKSTDILTLQSAGHVFVDFFLHTNVPFYLNQKVYFPVV